MTGPVPRVVVVGAGPAGVRATQALVEAGIRPVVIDEGSRAGGQIYRRQPEGFTRSYEKLYGTEARKARDIHESFDRLVPCIDYRPETLAWSVSPGVVHTSRGGRAEAVPYDALILCSGATDRIMPVQGWNMAGCYSLGASQIALKAQACSIGRRVAFLGSGPLLYLVASQYIAAGAQVAAVLDTSPARPGLGAVAALASRPMLALKGLGLVRSVHRAGVQVRHRVRPIRISASPEGGVESVVVRTPAGEEHFDCDAVAIGWHLRSESQLADLAGCEFRYDPRLRQWFPRVDACGRSSVFGVYLAGDGARIRGADGAGSAVDVLDDELLSECAPEGLLQAARHEIRRAASRERDDRRHRALGVGRIGGRGRERGGTS